ncbi:hypothetical protein BC826DRAFT_1105631 [Russula brevipes]|nr:hypothetical protein BC826DRAFT_1105631 [Russula brevipes]
MAAESLFWGLADTIQAKRREADHEPAYTLHMASTPKPLPFKGVSEMAGGVASVARSAPDSLPPTRGLMSSPTPAISMAAFPRNRSGSTSQMSSGSAPACARPFSFIARLAPRWSPAHTCARGDTAIAHNATTNPNHPFARMIRSGSCDAGQLTFGGHLDSSRHRKQDLWALYNALAVQKHPAGSTELTVRALLNAGWAALLPAFFFLLTTNLSDPLFGDVLGALQALARAAGFLALPAPRDAFLTTLAKTHFPHALLPRSKNRRRRSLLWSGPLVGLSPSHPLAQFPGRPLAPSARRPLARSLHFPAQPRPLARSPHRLIAPSPGSLVALWLGRPVAPSRHLARPRRPLACPLVILWPRPLLWHGNKRRALWKTTCTRTALYSHLSFAECALYAALAPSVQALAVLNEALARLGGGFGGPSGRVLYEEMGGEVGDEEDDPWWADIEQELQTYATMQVQEGLSAVRNVRTLSTLGSD